MSWLFPIFRSYWDVWQRCLLRVVLVIHVYLTGRVSKLLVFRWWWVQEHDKFERRIDQNMSQDNFFLFLSLFVCAASVECKICPSMDIRNSVTELNKLKNCTEIVGYLSIVLMERVKGSYEFDQYVFPELTKITGYLFFYRILHLTSVGKLFPNLMVIRGYELFTDYALVIYNMPHLTEVKNTFLIVSATITIFSSFSQRLV